MKLLNPQLDVTDKEGVMFFVEIKESTPDVSTAYWTYATARQDFERAGFRVHTTRFKTAQGSKSRALHKGEGIVLAMGSAQDLVKTVAALHTGTSDDIGADYSLFMNAKKIPFEKAPDSLAELLWEERWSIAGLGDPLPEGSRLRGLQLDPLLRATRLPELELPSPKVVEETSLLSSTPTPSQRMTNSFSPACTRGAPRATM